MKEERTLFHWPIRKSTTAAFYPEKISIDDFVEFIKDGIDPWAANMRGLNNVKPQYIEWWLECFAAWSEVEVE